MHGRSLQDLRGTSQEAEPEHRQHHLRHFAVVRFYRSACRSVMPRLSEEHQHLCSLQQGLDQGEDLHPAATSGGPIDQQLKKIYNKKI